MKVLFLTRVGDVALDVPDANVIIQISSNYGSRLQEAQRLGRILRKGRQYHAASQFNAFFYTLISTDTAEVYFSAKRRRYLVDQGYAYKVVHPVSGDGAGIARSRAELESGCPFMTAIDEQERTLRELQAHDVDAEERTESRHIAAAAEDSDEEPTLRGRASLSAASRALGRSMAQVTSHAVVPSASRAIGSMHAWSTAGDASYMEYTSTDRIDAAAAAEQEAARARKSALKQAVAEGQRPSRPKPRQAPSYADRLLR